MNLNKRIAMDIAEMEDEDVIEEVTPEVEELVEKIAILVATSTTPVYAAPLESDEWDDVIVFDEDDPYLAHAITKQRHAQRRKRNFQHDRKKIEMLTTSSHAAAHASAYVKNGKIIRHTPWDSKGEKRRNNKRIRQTDIADGSFYKKTH